MKGNRNLRGWQFGIGIVLAMLVLLVGLPSAMPAVSANTLCESGDSVWSYDTETGRWVEARDLRLGDELLLTGGRACITGLATEDLDTTVYNIGVGEQHTYAVSEAGVLVHNKAMRNSAFVDDGIENMDVMLGQSMKRRVKPAAEKIGAKVFEPKGKWSGAENMKFIEDAMDRARKGKGHIYDVGWDNTRISNYRGPKSIYGTEKGWLDAGEFECIFTGRWITAENGKKFRLWEWVPK